MLSPGGSPEPSCLALFCRAGEPLPAGVHPGAWEVTQVCSLTGHCGPACPSFSLGLSFPGAPWLPQASALPSWCLGLSWVAVWVGRHSWGTVPQEMVVLPSLAGSLGSRRPWAPRWLGWGVWSFPLA